MTRHRESPPCRPPARRGVLRALAGTMVARVFALLLAGLMTTAAVTGTLAVWRARDSGLIGPPAPARWAERVAAVVLALDAAAPEAHGPVWALARASGVWPAGRIEDDEWGRAADPTLAGALAAPLQRPVQVAQPRDARACAGTGRAPAADDMANEKNHATKPPHAARAAHALHCRIVTTQTAAGAPLALAVGTPLSPWGEWPLGPLGPRGPGLVGWAVPLAFVAALLLLAAAITRMALLPLAALLRGAERFGNDMDAPPLPERGPREIRTAVAAFNRMQQRIREHVRERTSMLGAIAHDLQTPLTRLRLRLEQVDDAALRERLADDLAECEVRVREGLDLARSLDDRAPLASVALDALLQSACDEAQDAGARVQAPAAASGLTVRARPQALLRCVENLIGNAVKYGGSAEVVAWRDGAHAVIAVRDHGPGIPPADLERVFEPFVRLEPSRSRETGGTGLGLAIVRNLMRAQRGSVSLRNRGADEGGGLEACLTIPLAAPPLAREASA